MSHSPQPDRDFPWWLVLLAGIGAYLFWQVMANELYAQVLATLVKGIGITIFVTSWPSRWPVRWASALR